MHRQMGLLPPHLQVFISKQPNSPYMWLECMTQMSMADTNNQTYLYSWCAGQQCNKERYIIQSNKKHVDTWDDQHGYRAGPAYPLGYTPHPGLGQGPQGGVPSWELAG